MRYMISYDISVSKKRYEVIKVLEKFGCYRVQKSVYFGDLEKLEAFSLRESLKKYFRNESLLIIPFEGDTIKKAIFLCKAPSLLKKGDIFIWNF